MENKERDFKGVWIPKEIWLNDELTLLEKCIFVEIDSLDNENHCTASNEYFAEFCNCSESKVSKAIKKLVELDMIEVMEFDGRHRKIRGRVVKSTRQSSKKYEAESYKEQTNNINNKTINNKLFLSRDKNNSQHTNIIVDLYHRHCYNLPKVKVLTDKRKKAIERLCKKHDINEITTAFDLANSSDFLMGNNDRGWKADLDFILREDKFVSILEGKYCNRKNQTLSQRINESGTSNVPTFTDKDQEKLKEFQEQLRKDGKQIYF